MPAPVVLARSRAIPVTVERAFALTLPIPLTAIFSRRYGLLPPVGEVRGQVGVWARAGQTRTVVTTDGGTMREHLTEVTAPHAFGYRLGDITGPLRPFVHGIDGRWEFVPRGTGTEITWQWVVHPTRVGVPVMPLISAMWRGYARQALEVLSDRLLASDSGESAPPA